MTVTLRSTTRIVEVNGVPGRVWEGESEHGVVVYAVVTRIAAAANANLEEFERDLQECATPSAKSFEVIPTRFIL